MRISELSRVTGLTVATIKYYLRQGLMPGGTAITATQSEYGAEHVERLRLIRALIDVGGLPLSSVATILKSLDDTRASGPPVTAPIDVVNTVADALPPMYPPSENPPQRALATMQWLGWPVNPDSTALRQLEHALSALEGLGLTPTPNTLQVYADAARQVAEAEVAAIPRTPKTPTPPEALRHVIVGTVMYEPLLIALRRLARQNLLNDSFNVDDKK